MNIVILAAGQGKRMRSGLPKVLHPVAGQPMLTHVINAARTVGAETNVDTRVIIVVGHGADQVKAAYAAQPDLNRDLMWALQSPQLGTGHAVQQAAPLMNDDAMTLVLYGDVPLVTPATLRQLVAAASQPPAGIGVLTVTLPDPTGYGRIVRDWHGNVLKIVEQKDAHGDELAITEVNTGILCAPTARLKAWLSKLSNNNAQQEYYLTDVIAMAVRDGVRVSGVHCADAEQTHGVNSKAQLANAERVAQSRRAAALMDAGVTLADPARVDMRGTVEAGTDVFIDVNNVFEGRVVLGDGVRLGPNNVLRNVTIGAGTQVHGFCFLENASIGRNASIGPFARTRPDVTLADEVHIGNFVEVKNSQMGAGSKANHLAYVGDASVGARVNIGAGTIVANYDGANKHKTVIEDDVHTGSNSVLVAPITLGAGATVGAGSTVTRQVPAGKLTVARAKQVTLDGWKRPVKAKKER